MYNNLLFGFYKNWTCGRVFSKEVRRPCYWCYTQTHTYTYTYNGFTPDTRRVVGRPGLAWREVSVRSTGFHYPWTGRRQPGGTLQQEVYKQREIRLASEPVGTAIVTCTTRPPADTVANGSTIPSDARHRRAWVSGETVIGARTTLTNSFFYPTSSSILIR